MERRAGHVKCRVCEEWENRYRISLLISSILNEKTILSRRKNEKIFEKSIDSRAGSVV
jgi:hypothetical protein